MRRWGGGAVGGGVEFAVVGNGAISGGPAWCGGKEVTCCWEVLEEIGEGLHGFGCWWALVVQVRGEESVDRDECRVLVDEKWL